MATCKATVPDLSLSGDAFYGPLVTNEQRKYFWKVYGFDGNKDDWDDGWGWDDPANLKKALARTFNGFWALTYSAPDHENDGYGAPSILNWARRYVRDQIEDVRARCGEDPTRLASTFTSDFGDERLELYLPFFFTISVPERASCLLHECRHFGGKEHDADFPKWSTLAGIKGQADSSWGSGLAYEYEASYLALFSAVGTGTTLAMRERARQRANWIVDNCFAKHPGISFGPVFHDAPTALAPAEGRLELLVRGVQGGVHRKGWTGKAWSPSPTGWESVGGELIGVPAAVSWNHDRLDVFAAGRDRRVYHRFRTGGKWGPDATDPNRWEDLDGATTIAPAVVSWGEGRLDLFVRGIDLRVFHKAWDVDHWVPSPEGWEPLDGECMTSPVAVSWSPGRLDVFARNRKGMLLHRAWNDDHWTPGWENLGGPIIGSPAVTSWAPNRLDLIVRGADDRVFHKAWDGKRWLPLPGSESWEPLGGSIKGSPTVVSWAPNRLDVFARGNNDRMFHKAWIEKDWSPTGANWEDLGGQFRGSPASASWGINRLDVFGIGQDSAVYHKAFQGGWLPSKLGWEVLGGLAG